ncbi:Capsid protein VP1 [Phytophthora citrophthora]|uniref:Capsid protein VP1 n=1 Tax=Phytophthora citrophthora TaxID=4793 RepID=A0AAD9LIQ5_9STRA|nr:Capsid protein VP1 [Phytophthora citrophthora]
MRDWTLPGYKYLGPGNKLNKDNPTRYGDAVAKEHDIGYDKDLKRGRDPYWNWNDADNRFLKKIKLNEYGGLAGYTVFGLKRGAARAGLIGTLNSAGTKKAKLAGTNDKKAVAVSNMPSTLTMVDGEGSGNDAGLKETPVDNPYIVYRGPPDYSFCSLPFTETRNIFQASVYNYDSTIA